MKTKYLSGLKNTLCLLACAALLGCQAGQDGDPGPQGPAGPAGAKGPQGLPGASGTPVVKLGSITGTVTGFRSNGSAFEETINYQYATADAPTFFDQYNGKNLVGIYRQDSLGLGRLTLQFETDAGFANPRFTSGDFESDRAGANNQYDFVEAYYSFWTYNKTYTRDEIRNTISNLSYSAATGLLTGSFDWQVTNVTYFDDGFANNEDYLVQFNNTSANGKPLRIKGTFSVPLKQRSYRVRAGQ